MARGQVYWNFWPLVEGEHLGSPARSTSRPGRPSTVGCQGSPDAPIIPGPWLWLYNPQALESSRPRIPAGWWHRVVLLSLTSLTGGPLCFAHRQLRIVVRPSNVLWPRDASLCSKGTEQNVFVDPVSNRAYITADCPLSLLTFTLITGSIFLALPVRV